MIYIGFLIICVIFGIFGGAVAGEVGLIGGALLGALLMIFAQLQDIHRTLMESKEEKN
ncbi:hypothetical protein [Alkaliphilus metalliredigens]|nr:hypothetical protein [Alkaliphilus metalliredigens]